MSRRPRQTISEKRLRKAESFYKFGSRFSRRVADAIARQFTGATVQVAWEEGNVEDNETPWAKSAGDTAIRGLRKVMPRFWKNGYEFSANYLELSQLHASLAKGHGHEKVRLAVAYRSIGGIAHIGTFRDGQEPQPSGEVITVFSREGADAAEFSLGAAVDTKTGRTFVPVETHTSERLPRSDVAEGVAVV